MCLNAGTVLWYRHDYSHQVLMDWWHSTMESYADNPLKRFGVIFDLASHFPPPLSIDVSLGSFVSIGHGNKIVKWQFIIGHHNTFK
jgi:hypothetical protein